jgi:hypothetical protein
MESNTQGNKGVKRIVGDKIHYYQYKQIMLSSDTHQELRKQSKDKGMSMPKYISHLLQINK